jgi:predicted ATPase
LSEKLNCLIGARGTGKTSVFELIRYALDALPDTQSRRRIESLVQKNLDSGRVLLTLQAKEGLTYTVSRAAGEEPVVLDERGEPTAITLRSGGVFCAHIYSQNEVEAIADRPLAQLDLVDRFETEAVRDIDRKLLELRAAMEANGAALLPIEEQIAALTEELGTLPALQQRLVAMTAQGGGQDGPVNQAHAHKSLRDREKRSVEAAKQLLMEARTQAGKLAAQINERTNSLFAQDLLTGPNATQLSQARQAVLNCTSSVEGFLRMIQDQLAQGVTLVDRAETALKETHARQELQFQELLRQQSLAQGEAAERTRLERLKNDLHAKQRQREDLRGRRAELLAQRQGMLERLSELRDARFTLREGVARRINEALGPSIRVSVEQAGNAEAYCQLLQEALKPHRLKHGQVAEKISQTLLPADLAAVVRRKDLDALTKAGLNADQAQKAMSGLSDPAVLLDLEVVELADLPKIELKDGERYKDSTSLSTGQKCTVILPILLLENEGPLLVDQPEDNLDNRFICDVIIKTILAAKRRRQLIFVTHNPNIPVLGDADRLFVLDSDGAKGWVQKEGGVDECREQLVTLLEGGEEAFRLRKERYGHHNDRAKGTTQNQ